MRLHLVFMCLDIKRESVLKRSLEDDSEKQRKFAKPGSADLQTFSSTSLAACSANPVSKLNNRNA